MDTLIFFPDPFAHAQSSLDILISDDLKYEIFFPEPTAHAQYPLQATESPNDDPTCPAVQSTQVTEQEDTGELTSY